MRRRSWFLAIIGLALLIAVPSDAFAQRRGGSRSRSRPSPSRRSSPKPKASKPRASKPKASNPKRGKAGGKASKDKGWGSDKKKAGKSKKVTKEDQKAYDRAKASGKTAPTRAAAMDKFRSNPANANKYTSSYATQPATRPGHIPPTYVGVGGTTYNIGYDQRYGGYGYMGSGGSWIAYNAMADVGMSSYYNRQLASAGYMYGPRPVIVSRGFGFGSIALVLLVLVVLGMILIPRSRRSASNDQITGT